MKTKRKLDERELMELYKVEHYSFWAIYGLLFVSIFVQLIFCGTSFTQIAGEWIVLMLATVGGVYANLKGGHYDYIFEPCKKSYLIYALVGATLADVLYCLIIYLQFNYHNTSIIFVAAIIWAVMFAILYVALYLYGEAVKKKRKELERLLDEDDEGIIDEVKSTSSKKWHKVFFCFMLFIALINLLIILSINKQDGYYIGRIQSMKKVDGITTVEISPMQSNRSFIYEIKANHKIEYANNIGISGIRDMDKEGKELYPGLLGEEIDKLNEGDPIIFKLKDYNKNDYKLDIECLAVDLT